MHNEDKPTGENTATLTSDARLATYVTTSARENSMGEALMQNPLTVAPFPPELIERTARRICINKDIDPDANVPQSGHQHGCDILLYGPAWRNYEDEALYGLCAIWEVEQWKLDRVPSF